MMRGLIERAATRRVVDASARLARIAADELPDDRIADGGAGIAIEGDGLLRRVAFDARLRGLGALVRGRR